LNEVPVTVAAEWTGLELTVRELLALKPGDVISLEPNITETVRVNISSAPKFTARFGTSGANWAVELSEPISQ
jgi:flagellar motor switch protein FliM